MRHLLASLALLVIATGPTHAQSDTAGFQSPSKNISCLVFPDGQKTAIRCDIAAMDTKPKRPADCELEYGQAFMMDSRGSAERICYGDALTDKVLPSSPMAKSGNAAASPARWSRPASPAPMPIVTGSRCRGQSRSCFERPSRPSDREAVANGAKSKRPSRPSDREAVANGAVSERLET